MKKRWLLLFLVPLLALAMVSCDAEMRSSLADTMDKFGTNVYIESGLVEKNLADAAAAKETISSLGSAESSTITDDDKDSDGNVSIIPGVPVKPPETGKTLKPQGENDQKKLKDNLADAFNSPQQKEQLKSDMGKKIEDTDRKDAVKGAVEVVNATIDYLLGDTNGFDDELKTAVGKLKIDEFDEEDLTEGDLLLVQMMTNLIANTVDKFSSIDDDTTEEEGMALLLSVIDDALFTAQVAEELSGAASIDFSGQLDLMGLLSGLDDGSKSILRRSGEGDSDDELNLEAFLGTINALGPELVGIVGLQKQKDGSYDWLDGGYRSFITNQQTYRGSLEFAVSLANKGELNLTGYSEIFDSSTAIKYLLATIFIELDEWSKKYDATVDGENALRYLLRTVVSENTWIATGTMKADTEFAFEEEDYSEINLETIAEFLVFRTDLGKGEAYVAGILQNVSDINRLGGIGMLSDLIDEFLDDEFAEFWEELEEDLLAQQKEED